MKKEKIKIMTKAKFIYHAMKTKEILIAMIFPFVLTLKNIIIWIKKDMKWKTSKSLKERRFSEFATFCQKRKININQFAKKKRFKDFLKDETLIKSQNNLCVSTTFNEYNSKMNIMCLQKKIYDKHISKATHTAV